jgi:23S rRNA U2552 (ribose-2'-O)-methylase RlmE/FtsJ
MTGQSRITPNSPGFGRIMITDNGSHPPEFWAQVTAEQIAPIAEDMTGARRFAALSLQAKIAEALIPHHEKVQADESTRLTADARHKDREVHLDQIDSAHLDEVISDIVEAATGTEWEDHFKDAAVQKQIRFEIARHFASVQHVARSWHRTNLLNKGSEV